MVPRIAKIRTDQIISLISLSAVFLLYRGLENTGSKVEPLADFNPDKLVYSRQVVPIPLFSASDSSDSAGLINETLANPETISASSAAVIDVDSSSIVFSKNGNEKLLPASTTKLMTAVISREYFNLDEVIRIENPPDVDGAAIKFYQGEEITVENLLQALLIQSGNDAALILASHHPEGIEGFVRDMNLKAADLNMKNTSFENVIGFDHPNHYSTAIDLALLSREAMKDEVIRAIVKQPKTLITDITGTKLHYLYSTNALLARDSTVVGIKTGTTEGAGEVLITQVERDGRPILIVVMGSADRYLDTNKLIAWVYGHHRWLEFDELN